mmetsp:Transcript_51861/g.112442  ORF Transcript_51861/g.112442 Transcript_51861/m.112442 type:complete len:231 (-) Transcript_51861:157-849(-)
MLPSRLLHDRKHPCCSCTVRHGLEYLAVPLVEVQLGSMWRVAEAALAAIVATSCDCENASALAKMRMSEAAAACYEALRAQGRLGDRVFFHIGPHLLECETVSVRCGGSLQEIPETGSRADSTREGVPRSAGRLVPREGRGLALYLATMPQGDRRLHIPGSLGQTLDVPLLLLQLRRDRQATGKDGFALGPAQGVRLASFFNIDEGRPQREPDRLLRPYLSLLRGMGRSR